ncbi:MAG: biotin--[acetyl-CoA-carboxylase] ligase [Alphaproteobacteria bacterium]|nr:biotin--[acetyl-CoA-carboxylase] ligase [Alphaproteobacteria bacterium]
MSMTLVSGSGHGVAMPPGWRLVRFDTVDSTNEQARRLAVGGAEHGTVVVADVQTGGLGRRGRQWISPLGNLHCSIVVRPRRPVSEIAQLSLVTAVAVAEALGDVAPGLPFRCKWPNDILCRGQKLCGILLESDVNGVVVIGIGVDVNSAPREGMLYPTTSLQAEGGTAGVDAVLAAVCLRLSVWVERWTVDGMASVRDAWLNLAGGVGELVAVRVSDERTITGTLVGLDADGALLLADGREGQTHRIVVGDVLFERPRT